MLHSLIIPLILVSNLKIYDSLLYLQDSPKNIRYPLVSNIFMLFLFNNRYHNWLLKIGWGGWGGGRVVTKSFYVRILCLHVSLGKGEAF